MRRRNKMQVFILVAEQGYASIKEVYLGEYRNGSLHCYPERL